MNTNQTPPVEKVALLEAVLEGTATAVGDAYLTALVTTLTRVFKVRYAVIGRLQAEHSEIRTLKVCADGALAGNIVYPLAGTPCEQVVGLTPRYFATGAADLFPDDALLRQLKIDCYLGVPLFSADQQALGNLLLMDSKPLPEALVPLALKLLELFGLRTAGEIERIEREQLLLIQDRNLGIILNESKDGLFSCDSDVRIVAVNPAYCTLLGYTEAELIGKHISDIEQNDSPQEIAERSRKLLEQGYDRFISRHRCKDGSARDLELSISYLPQNGSFFTIARDLTERLQLEHQLQESTERYKAFTELTSDFCHVCIRTRDSDYRIQWLGGQFQRITGYTDDELYHFGCWLPLIHPDDRERVEQSLRQMQPGDQHRSEFRMVHKNQSIRWIRVRSRCVQAPENPDLLRLYGSARDITAIRENALALQAAESAYRTIFNAVNDAVFILDPASGMIIDCNKKGMQIFARPREALIGATPLDLTPSDQPGFGPEEARQVIQAAAAGTPQLYEWLCSRPDGSNFWGEVSLTTTEINGRNRLLAVVRDISERKQLDERLAESEHRFRALVEKVPHLPVQGYDRNRNVIFWNRASEELYGYSCDEALGKKLEELIIPAGMRDGVVEAVQQWVEHDIPIPAGELQLQTKSGSLVDVFSSHAMLRSIRGEFEMYCVDLDISRQKQAALELQRTRDAAQAATIAKNEFLANMSHEVRTPLNGIMGLSQLLRTTELTSEQSEYLDMLDNSSRNLLLLINDILDISRIEAGSLRLESTPFSPLSLLHEVVEIYTKPASEKGINLELKLPGPLPKMLQGDPLRLKQVLINLVGNAVKFTSQGGVTLSVHPLPSQDDRIWLNFEVADSGIGMSPETARKVFNAFTQADSSTARVHGGSGLGLAICRRLTDLMQGSIRLESNLGQGSCFTVQLPFELCDLAREAEESDVGTAGQSRPPAGCSILLVEDQEVNRTFVQRLLERQGYRVTPAADGLMALDLLERQHFDLMLLDIQMPGMGGEEVLAHLRADEQQTGSHLQVIALTAHALAGDRELLLESGFDGYVGKPVQMQQLLAEMGRVLET